MINRENWTSVKKYLEYLDKVKQLDVRTIDSVRGYMRHLLQWADARFFWMLRISSRLSRCIS
jgi:hypothetical protein